VDGRHGERRIGAVLEPHTDRLRQRPAGLIEGLLVVAKAAPTGDADEDRGHDGSGRLAVFGANLGQSRPIRTPANTHRKPRTTSERATNCAAISAGTLLSKACG